MFLSFFIWAQSKKTQKQKLEEAAKKKSRQKL
jgi:hypothetical protein